MRVQLLILRLIIIKVVKRANQDRTLVCARSVQNKTNLLAISTGLFIPRTTGVERTGEGELKGCARGGMGVCVFIRV